MYAAPLRAAGVTGLVLVALSVTASAAATMDPSMQHRSPYGRGTISASTQSSASCPCNTGLPDGPSGALVTTGLHATGTPASAIRPAASTQSSASCPCNTGLPDGPSGVLVTTGLHATGTPASAIRPAASTTFDWADAAVGAGVTAVICLLLASAVGAIGRRRWLAKVAAASRP
jgi:hypothetical protein